MFGIIAENEAEERILADPYFRQAVLLGRPRHGHPEGVLSVHIAHILAAIDALGLPEQLRSRFRIAAMLHDTGKFADAPNVMGYHPDGLSEEERHAFFAASVRFRDEFRTDERDALVPMHALYSWQYAKRFTDDPLLLDLIKYHDTGFEIRKLHDAEGALRAYFRPETAGLYVLFSYVDSVDREKDTALWMQEKFLKLGLLGEKVV